MRQVDPQFGELIKKSRLEKRLTQEKVAELIDCHTQYYKNLENGIGMPSLPMFCKIMRTLNISADDYVYPSQNNELPVYKSLLQVINQCDEYKLTVLLATAEALLKGDSNIENNK